jgi:hypothetical protein
VYQIYWVGRSSLLFCLFLTGLGAPAIAETLNQPNLGNPSSLSSKTNSKTILDSKTEGEDIPEEVLRAEIYTEARSPLDGRLLSASEYIELNELLEATTDNIPPRLLVSDRLQRLIDLLKLRKLIRQVIPFF